MLLAHLSHARFDKPLPQRVRLPTRHKHRLSPQLQLWEPILQPRFKRRPVAWDEGLADVTSRLFARGPQWLVGEVGPVQKN